MTRDEVERGMVALDDVSQSLASASAALLTVRRVLVDARAELDAGDER